VVSVQAGFAHPLAKPYECRLIWDSSFEAQAGEATEKEMIAAGVF